MNNNVFNFLSKEKIFMKIKNSTSKREFEFYTYLILTISDDEVDLIEKLKVLANEKQYSDIDFKKLLFRSILTKGISSVKENSKIQELLKNTESDYNEFIDKFLYLANELNINSSVELSHLFSYLLYNGIFSITSNHCYSIKNRMNIHGAYAYDIFTGGGVCLNYSDMLNDILTKSNHCSSLIINCPKNVDRDYKMEEIKRNVNLTFSSKALIYLTKPISMITGSHACVLISEKNKTYVYDPTNITMFSCIKFDKANHLLGNGMIELKPFFSCGFAKDIKNILAIKRLYVSDMMDESYDKSFFIDSLYGVLGKCEHNQGDIKDFHYEIIPNIKNIVERSYKYKVKK